jgi:hypothetical protein
VRTPGWFLAPDIGANCDSEWMALWFAFHERAARALVYRRSSTATETVGSRLPGRDARITLRIRAIGPSNTTN